MTTFGFFAFLVVVSAVLALLEIQIEGKAGWAGNLPCWRIEKGWFVKWVWGGRPLTGYHVYLLTFLLLLLHFPALFVDWTWKRECLAIGFFLAMWPMEDFLWFVLNPDYGIRSFKPGQIPWHKSWLGPMPTCYVGYVVSCIPLLCFGMPALK